MLATRNTKMQVNISVFLFSSKLKTQLSSSADSSRLSTRTFVWGLYKLTRLVCCVAQEGDDRGELCFYSSAHPYAATLSSLSSLVLLSVPICCWVQKNLLFLLLHTAWLSTCVCFFPIWACSSQKQQTEPVKRFFYSALKENYKVCFLCRWSFLLFLTLRWKLKPCLHFDMIWMFAYFLCVEFICPDQMRGCSLAWYWIAFWGAALIGFI